MSPPVIAGPTIVTVQLDSIPETSAACTCRTETSKSGTAARIRSASGPSDPSGAQHHGPQDELAGDHHLLHVEDGGLGQRAEHARGDARTVDADDGRVEGGVRHAVQRYRPPGLPDPRGRLGSGAAVGGRRGAARRLRRSAGVGAFSPPTTPAITSSTWPRTACTSAARARASAAVTAAPSSTRARSSASCSAASLTSRASTWGSRPRGSRPSATSHVHGAPTAVARPVQAELLEPFRGRRDGLGQRPCAGARREHAGLERRAAPRSPAVVPPPPGAPRGAAARQRASPRLSSTAGTGAPSMPGGPSDGVARARAGAATSRPRPSTRMARRRSGSGVGAAPSTLPTAGASGAACGHGLEQVVGSGGPAQPRPQPHGCGGHLCGAHLQEGRARRGPAPAVARG